VQKGIVLELVGQSLEQVGLRLAATELMGMVFLVQDCSPALQGRGILVFGDAGKADGGWTIR
jgi:hypothetical protein